MSGPQQGAAIAAVLFEGWAANPSAAKDLLASGEIRLETNHEHHGVGGMAGVVSPSMLVYVVTDRTSGKRAYSLQEYDSFYGAFDAAALEEIRRWNSIYMPALGRAIGDLGGLPLKQFQQLGLTMGDDLHCRQHGASAMTLGQLASAIVRTSGDTEAAATLQVLASLPYLLFLGLNMAASKATLLAAEGVTGSSLVTVMARNGTDVGIQVAGLPGRWFTAPAPPIHFVPFDPATTTADACHDLGDSAICETNGFGGFSAAAAPELAHEVGLTVDQLVPLSREMARICLGEHTDLPIPQLGSGPPVGVDVHRVVSTGITPVIFTAVAPKGTGGRILGLGRSRIPLVSRGDLGEKSGDQDENWVPPSGVMIVAVAVTRKRFLAL